MVHKISIRFLSLCLSATHRSLPQKIHIFQFFVRPSKYPDVGIFLIDAFNSFYRHTQVYAFLISSLIRVRLKCLRLLKIEIQEVKVNVIGIVCVSAIDMNAPMMEKIEFIFQPLELAFSRCVENKRTNVTRLGYSCR